MRAIATFLLLGSAAGLGDVDGRGRPDMLIGDYDSAYLFLGEE